MLENGLVYFYIKSFMFGLASRPPNFKPSVCVEAKNVSSKQLSNTTTIYLPKINEIVYSYNEANWQIIADQSGKLSERLPGHVLVFCQMRAFGVLLSLSLSGVHQFTLEAFQISSNCKRSCLCSFQRMMF